MLSIKRYLTYCRKYINQINTNIDSHIIKLKNNNNQIIFKSKQINAQIIELQEVLNNLEHQKRINTNMIAKLETLLTL